MSFKGSSVINTAILGIILVTVLFSAYAEIMPSAQDSGDKLGDEYRCNTVAEASSTCFYNASRATDCTENNKTAADTTACTTFKSVPLSGLFGTGAVVFIVVMCFLLVLVIKSFLPKGK